MTTQFRTFALLGFAALIAAACTDDVTSTDTSGETDTASLAGNAVVDPCSIDFGTLQKGEIASAPFAVKNTGLGALEILSVTVGAPFSTTAQPVQVGSSQNYQTTVRFEPGDTDFGLFTSELIVETDDPDEPSIVCSVSGSVTDDADLDGFVTVEAGGDDCNDNDADINPGATEIWYDDIDQDCAGDSDFDQDGDGYDTQFSWEDPSSPNPKTGLPGGDCQDVDPTINPSIEEVWYDGKDANCDGQNDFDRDGDGYRTAEFGYDDCDDDDPLANPEAIEAFNGSDDDCNGRVDDKASPERADRIAYGDDDEWAVGRGLGVADVDGSGVPDVLVGCHYYEYSKSGATTGDGPGGVAIFWDNGLEDQDYICGGDEDVFIEGEGTMEFGFELITADFTGDGQQDFATTARGDSNFAGKVMMFDGAKLSSTTTVNDYEFSVSGLTDYQLGSGLGTGDIDGDGSDDLVMFGTDRDELRTYMGLHYGGGDVLGDYDWTDLDASFYETCGTAPIYSWYLRTCGPQVTSLVGDGGGADQFAANGHGHADFDGDGYDDVLFGDGWSDSGGPANGGSAWILFGRRAKHTSSNAIYKDTLTVVASGGASGDLFGGSVAVMPDIDADGDDEMLIHDDGRSRLYLVEGGTDVRFGYDDIEEAAIATFTGVSQFSSAVDAGDWDGDGVGDIALGFGDDSGGGKGGSLYMIASNEWAGEVAFEANSYGSIIGDTWNVSFGLGAPLLTGDLDGNGTSDLIVGDYRYDNEDLTDVGPEGAVFVFYNTNE